MHYFNPGEALSPILPNNTRSPGSTPNLFSFLRSPSPLPLLLTPNISNNSLKSDQYGLETAFLFDTNSASASETVENKVTSVNENENADEAIVSEKKLKHRQIDAKRKSRENAAFHSLQQLTCNVANVSFDEKKRKAVVLEEAIQVFTKLHRQFQDTHRQLQQEQQFHQSTMNHLHQQLAQIATPSPLLSKYFIHAGVMLSCMDMTGRMVDVNQVWLNHMCWKSSDVLGRVVSSLAAYMPLISAAPSAKTTFDSTELAPIKPHCCGDFQYMDYPATTITDLRRLISKELQAINILERLVIGCGKLVEVQATCWLVDDNSGSNCFFMSSTVNAISKRLCRQCSVHVDAIDTSAIVSSSRKLICPCCANPECFVTAPCSCPRLKKKSRPTAISAAESKIREEDLSDTK